MQLGREHLGYPGTAGDGDGDGERVWKRLGSVSSLSAQAMHRVCVCVYNFSLVFT